jgi:maleylpyruvate isomerase
MASLTLYDYWRSGSAYRTRIALNLKGLDYAVAPVNLRAMAHRERDYLALNPQGLTPTLVCDGVALTQSQAIFEWLEETCPLPPLLPSGSADRAVVRAMVAVVACDIHPMNNLRVLRALREDLAAPETAVTGWIHRWIAEGFEALEAMIARHGQGFAFGDRPTFADCALIPQVYSAERFAMDLSPYPHILAVRKAAEALPAFADAHPDARPDAVPAAGR